MKRMKSLLNEKSSDYWCIVKTIKNHWFIRTESKVCLYNVQMKMEYQRTNDQSWIHQYELKEKEEANQALIWIKFHQDWISSLKIMVNWFKRIKLMKISFETKMSNHSVMKKNSECSIGSFLEIKLARTFISSLMSSIQWMQLINSMKKNFIWKSFVFFSIKSIQIDFKSLQLDEIFLAIWLKLAKFSNSQRWNQLVYKLVVHVDDFVWISRIKKNNSLEVSSSLLGILRYNWIYICIYVYSMKEFNIEINTNTKGEDTNNKTE